MWTSSRLSQRRGLLNAAPERIAWGVVVATVRRAFEERIRTLVKFINEQQEGLGPPSPVDEPENEKLLQLGEIFRDSVEAEIQASHEVLDHDQHSRREAGHKCGEEAFPTNQGPLSAPEEAPRESRWSQ